MLRQTPMLHQSLKLQQKPLLLKLQNQSSNNLAGNSSRKTVHRASRAASSAGRTANVNRSSLVLQSQLPASTSPNCWK